MNNKDMPAMPTRGADGSLFTGNDIKYLSQAAAGLTKLEYAAIHIAAGLVASGEFAGIESAAAHKAKALFEELERE